MNRKQKARHEYKMYCKGLRYGARYEVITTPAIRELIVNKKKIRRQQIWRLRGTEGYHLHMGSERSDNMANLIPKIAQMLGVELGEEFKIKGYDGLTYRFDSDGLKLTHDSGIELAQISANVAFADLVNGKDKIVKLPWKPSEGQTVYSFYARGISSVLEVIRFVWVGSVVSHQALVKAGWVYPTREEAEAALPKVAKELGVEYEL